ncbi:MAG: autotransporter domain-containing protein [Arenimonas sp.]|nr:autotransporter domain-containing protein [Arenimonas sp.]
MALAATPALADGPYSQTIFFGDSLTDSGFFRPLLPASVRPVTGQFTTNPGFVWSQHLAGFYGTTADPNGNGQTGTNYAAGGARVGINTTGALGPIPSLATQTSNYLAANGGVADSRALYTVWGGANDLFAITNAGAPAGTTITNAVTSQVGIVSQLTNAGARYILVSNIPDLGVSPAFRALGPAAQANGTALTIQYNNALFAGLATSGLRVIPLDSFNLIREIVASPGTYGFTNITGTACQPQITANSLTCNPTSYITPDAPSTYLFADGVHPTAGGHRVLADYAISILEAPRQIAVLPRSAASIGRSRADTVFTHLGTPPDDGNTWWIDVRGDSKHAGSDTGHDGNGPALAGGIDWHTGNTSFGVFAGFGRQDMDFAGDYGSFDQSDASLGAFYDWRGETTWAKVQLSYTWLDYDIDRHVRLGPATRIHSGSTEGSNLSLGAEAGYLFRGASVTHGPVLTVLSQQIDVDGYAEDQATLSTSLAYPSQSFDSIVAGLGWQFEYVASENFKPYGRISYNHELKDAPEEAFARSQSIVGSLPYAVPGLELDDSFAKLQLGARTKLFGVDANFGVNFSNSQGGGNDASVFASFSRGF